MSIGSRKPSPRAVAMPRSRLPGMARLLASASLLTSAAALSTPFLAVTTSGAAAQCTEGPSGTFVCSGALSTPQILVSPSGTPLSVTAEPDFSVRTTTGDAITLISENGITFTQQAGGGEIYGAGTTIGSGNGIYASNGGVEGALTITTTGTVSGGGSMADGIRALNNGANTTDLTIQAAAVNGGRYGIYARNSGSGALTITTTGFVEGIAQDGINAEIDNPTNGSDLTIVATKGVSGGDFGITAVHRGSGGLSITADSSVRGATFGIAAGGYGTGPVSVTVSGAVTGVIEDGIFVESASSQPLMVTINQTGSVTSTGTGADDFGIDVGGGAAEIVVSGPVTGGAGGAIRFDPLTARDDVLQLQSGFGIKGSVLAGDGTDTLRFGGTGADGFDLDRIDDGGGSRQYRGFDQFQVTGGTWIFSGTTTQTFSVFGGGALGGTGAFGELDVRPGGILSPGGTAGGQEPASPLNTIVDDPGAVGLGPNSGGIGQSGNDIGTISVNGDVTFGEGSIYVVQIDNQDNADLIAATGSVDIAGGETALIVAAEPGLFPSTPLVYTIITADGGVTGQFETVVDTLPDLDLVAVYTPNSVLLDYIVEPPSPDNPGRRGSSPKEIHPSATMSGLFSAHLFASSLQRRGELVTELETGGGSPSLALGFLPGSDMPRHLPPHLLAADMPGLPSAPVEPRLWNVWGQVLGNATELDDQAGVDGFDALIGGFAFGFERRFNGFGFPAYAGLGIGYTAADVDSDLSDADIDSFHIGAYGGLARGALALSGALSYAYQDYTFDRVIPFGGGTATAEGESHGHAFTASAEAFYDLSDHLAGDARSRHAWRFGPLLSADLHYAERAGFTETGVGILNLTVEGDEVTQGLLGIGASAGLTRAMGTALVHADVRLQWQHVVGDTGVATESGLVVPGANFVVDSVDVGRNRLVVGTGLGVEFSERLAAHIRCTGQLSETFQSHDASAGLTWRF